MDESRGLTTARKPSRVRRQGKGRPQSSTHSSSPRPLRGAGEPSGAVAGLKDTQHPSLGPGIQTRQALAQTQGGIGRMAQTLGHHRCPQGQHRRARLVSLDSGRGPALSGVWP